MPKKRRKSQDKPLKTMRIFCEGKNTEPNYLNRYIDECKNAQRAKVVDIKVEDSKKNTPIELVQEAINLKNSKESLPYDEFWVVYDRESPSEILVRTHIKAWNLAQRNNINIALSNVCFEYWVLLHFLNTTKPYTSYDDLLKNSSLNSLVLSVTGNSYDKSGTVLIPYLLKNRDVAKNRAMQLNTTSINNHPVGAKPYDINPYIGIITLLDAIENFN